jgi:hypothetical protein
MHLWLQWWIAIWRLRPARSRLRSFLWFSCCVAGITIRTDNLGVTSIVRALGLKKMFCDRPFRHRALRTRVKITSQNSRPDLG